MSTGYVVTCDGETASPVLRSIGEAEDYRDIMIAHFKDYLPMRFQIETDGYMDIVGHEDCFGDSLSDELEGALRDVDRLEDEANHWAAENKKLRQLLADASADIRVVLDRL